MSAKIKIESDIKMPTRNEGKNGSSKYPFADMEVGQSFLWPGNPKSASVYSYTTKAKNATGFKFATRKTEDGLRTWRVE